MHLIRGQESIQLNPLADDGWHKFFFFNILYLASINAWAIYKEVVGTKFKRPDYILNLADELLNNYVPAETSTLSNFTPGADDGPNPSSRKSKQCQI
ncbi:hypothetical protein AVEN_258909-1 [Araneus ventricosus]|uniref:PiggyBac transposable element-derived protein domain-containing protein n=1 Tax=Araneus ventricosus TaxID=182803 RepID=A0A4Y2DYW1_ARAVE|nr:hypothetical protein AVEN_5416-1 [Araneus ventricosus]GBM22095.1 hypothetical protein AVEN_258909-1 [Araneus ventricosus]